MTGILLRLGCDAPELTPLRDAELFPRQEMAALYRLRGDAEINLRSLRTMLRMDVLQCQSPHLVRKEIWSASWPTT